MFRGGVGHPEVGHCEALGPAALDLLERAEPPLDVDVRRRRGRQHEPGRHDADPSRVARVERPVGVQVADVVRRVPGRGEALEPEDAVADDVDVLLRHGRELAEQGIERIGVEPARARLQLARVDDVGRPDLRDVHLEPGVLADEGAGGTGVVEVDVGEEEMADVRQLEPALGETRLQRVDARRRPAVVNGRPIVGLDQVRADDALGLVVEVDRLVQGARRAR